jgi:hypothetical protein
MNKLKAKTFLVSKVTDSYLDEMFCLFKKYYENVDENKFKNDFRSKDKVIVLTDIDKNLRGFSTIKRINIDIERKKVHGIFSGDTVLDSNFWGGNELAIEFFKNVVKEKLKKPNKELYWFLISKGYKTYLLLANNFETYYPRFDRPIPLKELEILHLFAKAEYGNLYEEKSMLLKTAGKHDRLKYTVAPINEALKAKNPKIAFFEKMNPSWKDGDELCCIGAVDAGLVKKFCYRSMVKKFKKIRFTPLQER